MLGVSLIDCIRNEVIKTVRGLKLPTYLSKCMLKWQWAGNICRRTDNRWGGGKRSVGGLPAWFKDNDCKFHFCKARYFVFCIIFPLENFYSTYLNAQKSQKEKLI
jgi:hypothetical protein